MRSVGQASGNATAAEAEIVAGSVQNSDYLRITDKYALDAQIQQQRTLFVTLGAVAMNDDYPPDVVGLKAALRLGHLS